MDNCKLFVGNISYSANEDSLKELFGDVGEVKSVKIVVDNFTGRSRGFGFIEMSSPEEANNAIKDMNNKEFLGKTLKVDRAKSRKSGGDRGGFNRDRKPRQFM